MCVAVAKKGRQLWDAAVRGQGGVRPYVLSWRVHAFEHICNKDIKAHTCTHRATITIKAAAKTCPCILTTNRCNGGTTHAGATNTQQHEERSEQGSVRMLGHNVSQHLESIGLVGGHSAPISPGASGANGGHSAARVPAKGYGAGE